METAEAIPYEYQLFALAFREPDAISYFYDHLPSEDVGLVHGNVGLNQFCLALYSFYNHTGLDIVDPLTFKEYLRSETEITMMLGGDEGVDYFFEQLDKVKDLSTPESVTALLKHRADRKRQSDYATELQELLAKRDTVSEAERARIGLLTAQIQTIENQSNKDPLSRVKTGKDLAEMAESLWEMPDFIPTPWESLNRALGYSASGGICKGALSAILAPSGKGKSTFAKCLAKWWSEHGVRTLYINYEEVEKHWVRILMTQVTGQNVYMGDELTELQKRQFTEKFKSEMDRWGSDMWVLSDLESPFYEDLEQLLRTYLTMPEDQRPEAVVIDTIQSIFLKNSTGKPRWGQYEEMMVRLEKLAKDLGAAFVLTAQENTNRMKEKRDVVMQSDTGGSIAIVQKCSVTMHLVDSKMNDESEEEGLTEVQIPKNRITGTSFSHNPPMVRYNDSTKSYEAYEYVEDERYDGAVNMDDFNDF